MELTPYDTTCNFKMLLALKSGFFDTMARERVNLLSNQSYILWSLREL